jgi:hypothetical protein
LSQTGGSSVAYYTISGEQLAELIADAENEGWEDTAGKEEWGSVVAAYRDPNFYADGPHSFMVTVSGAVPTLIVNGGLPGESAAERGLEPNKVAEIEAATRAKTRRAKKQANIDRNMQVLMA